PENTRYGWPNVLPGEHITVHNVVGFAGANIVTADKFSRSRNQTRIARSIDPVAAAREGKSAAQFALDCGVGTDSRHNVHWAAHRSPQHELRPQDRKRPRPAQLSRPNEILLQPVKALVLMSGPPLFARDRRWTQVQPICFRTLQQCNVP